MRSRILNSRGVFILPAVALATAAFVGASDAHEEIVIGRHASGQLTVHFHAAEPIDLESSLFPGIDGYATGLMGFHSAELDDPEEGIFTLNPAASIQAILVGVDDGLRVYDGLRIMGVGDAMTFGSPFFDYHPIFNIHEGHPGETFTLRFVFHDLSGIHADSEEWAVTFTPAGSACIADFNGDGGIDGTDVEAFFGEWESGGHHADVNADGGIDGTDVGVFFDAWQQGSC